MPEMEYTKLINDICRKPQEVNHMPGRNGTGPMGAGAMTGRGLGPCAGTGSLAKGAGLWLGLGLGMACRRGFGRGFRQFSLDNELSAEDRKGLLRL